MVRVLATLMMLCALAASAMNAANAAQASLTWDYSPPGAAGFAVYCGVASRNYSNRFNAGNATSYTLTGLADNTTYYCTVVAYDGALVESPYSNELKFTTPPPVSSTPTPTPTPTPTTAPIALTSGAAVTLWPSTATPAVIDVPDSRALELGFKFRSSVAGVVTAIRFYKSTANTGAHTAHLWSPDGTLLSSATFTTESASGWQQVSLPRAVAIAPNTTYIASYHSNSGHFSGDPWFFTKTLSNGPLHALAAGIDGGNGVYAVGTTPLFPNIASPQAYSYAVDIVFTPCPCTIWPRTSAPARAGANEAARLELGVKFRSDVNGTITGIRFYKSTTNTGTHVGNLWTATGTLLARGTFINETASGWQQVDFATPVPITASTTYVASYHTNTGYYAADNGYFAAGADNGPLHALQDGLSGGNGVYVYSATTAFPTYSYKSTNYWVDVVLLPK